MARISRWSGTACQQNSELLRSSDISVGGVEARIAGPVLLSPTVSNVSGYGASIDNRFPWRLIAIHFQFAPVTQDQRPRLFDNLIPIRLKMTESEVETTIQVIRINGT
jgi:hypothetical protein